MKTTLCAAAALLCFMLPCDAQPKGANYDEAKAGGLEIPDPLKMESGAPVRDAKMWREQRRPELLHLFEREVYGKTPGRASTMLFEQASEARHALGGKATRREVTIRFSKEKNGPEINLLLYMPNKHDGSIPAFLGLNFDGNHTVSSDPGITLNPVWHRKEGSRELVKGPASENARGKSTGRWPIEMIIDRGYAIATAYYGDIDPDFHDGFQNGVHPLSYKPGQSKPANDEWGSIGAWAWGLSRALDYLETVPQIDSDKVALLGHSRLGKTALWAGAQDERFAIVISNNSGCGGAALSKRNFGETVAIINNAFPHWFCGNFKKYSNNEAALPVDQHELIALIAPRPVYVASAAEDLWADPKGEFLGAKLASPVYKLLGTEGLPRSEMPAVDEPVMGTIGYHNRTGKHDVTEYDWQQYLAFADKHFTR